MLKYEKMRKDVSDGTILSTVNGEVKAVGSPESGMDFSLPFITVTSQDGVTAFTFTMQMAHGAPREVL